MLQPRPGLISLCWLRDCDHGTMIVADSVDPGAAAEPLGYADILSAEATVSLDSVDITV